MQAPRPVPTMSRAALRRWLAGRAAAERREQQEAARTSPAPAESMRQALALIAFASRLHGWPLPDDAWSLREDQRGYACWDRLRAAWPGDGRRGR